MEQSFADLLGDAFAETSAPSFTDGELDFESLHFDEKFKEAETENLQTEEDEALQQETIFHTEDLSDMETEDVNIAETNDEDEADEEDYETVGVMSVERIHEEYYTSSEGDSEEEQSVSGHDEEDEEDGMAAGDAAGDLLIPVGNKEDMIFPEGRLLAPQGAEKPQDRNKEQGEWDEEVSFFERVPESGREMVTEGDWIEGLEEEIEAEKQEDPSNSESECMKVEQEENVDHHCFDEGVIKSCIVSQEKVSLDLHEVTVENLHDLIAEDKCEDFSGEEHQEAGESFADYPSDFSSCEYVQESQGNRHQEGTASDSLYSKSNAFPEEGPERGRMGGQDTDEEGDEYLYSRNLDEEFRNLDVENRERLGTDEGETDNTDSCSSSDNEEEVKRTDEEQDTYKGYEEAGRDAAGLNLNWNLDLSSSGHHQSEELLTTDDIQTAETMLSNVSREDVSTYSVLQKDQTKESTSSSQGSLDDNFFFNAKPETRRVNEEERDEDEGERSWEQEQERIKAFYSFYDDSEGEDGREGRQAKVQFCADPLSQVIHYESDSDRDSLSSSTDGEEGLNCAETSEELLETQSGEETKPTFDPPNTEIQEDVQDLKTAPVMTRKQKCLDMLKLALKMAMVILTGLVMFWFVTNQAQMFSPGPDF